MSCIEKIFELADTFMEIIRERLRNEPDREKKFPLPLLVILPDEPREHVVTRSARLEDDNETVGIFYEPVDQSDDASYYKIEPKQFDAAYIAAIADSVCGEDQVHIPDNRTIEICVFGGVVAEVNNIPEGWDYEINDMDVKESDEADDAGT